MTPLGCNVPSTLRLLSPDEQTRQLMGNRPPIPANACAALSPKAYPPYIPKPYSELWEFGTWIKDDVCWDTLPADIDSLMSQFARPETLNPQPLLSGSWLRVSKPCYTNPYSLKAVLDIMWAAATGPKFELLDLRRFYKSLLAGFKGILHANSGFNKQGV